MIKIFEDLMADVQYENPTLSETWFVRCYVNGLRDGIKYQLRPLRPASVTEAYWMARDVEPSHPPKKTYTAYTPGFQKFQTYTQTRQALSPIPPLPKPPDPGPQSQHQLRKKGNVGDVETSGSQATNAGLSQMCT